MQPSRVLLLAGVLAVCLIAGSTPRIVGDGGEYLAEAINFTSLNGPALRVRDIPRIQAEVDAFDSMLANWQIEDATVRGHDRRRDFVHFWFYAMLAAPALWLTHAAGAAPTYAFAALNLALLLLALRVALPRIGPAACLFIFAGPTIWWLDKIHTEAFTVALLTITFALLEERPGLAMIAAAAASTQNPPIGALVPLIAIAAVWRHRERLKDRTFLTTAAIAVALAALHPVYSYVRHDTLSLLLLATRPGMPDMTEISAILLDPDIGLIGNDPLFLMAVLLGLLLMLRRQPSALGSRGMVIAGISASVFLLSVARTGNHHHGGTPSLSRYALWLLPLAIPLFAWMRARGGVLCQRLLWTLGVASACISLFAFHPAVPQYGREPTWLAAWLWTHHPGWQNPLPEVFAEVHLRDERTVVPVTTAGCEKILIGGQQTDEGLWPVPCYPAPVPDRCRQGATCYANFNGRGYDFVPAPGRLAGPLELHAEWTWPAAAEGFMRRLYDEWGWQQMPFGADIGVLRQGVNVRTLSVGRPDRFLVVLRDAAAGAAVRLRPEHAMTAHLIDPNTGTTLLTTSLDGPSDDPVSIELPSGFSLLVLTLQ